MQNWKRDGAELRGRSENIEALSHWEPAFIACTALPGVLFFARVVFCLYCVSLVGEFCMSIFFLKNQQHLRARPEGTGTHHVRFSSTQQRNSTGTESFGFPCCSGSDSSTIAGHAPNKIATLFTTCCHRPGTLQPRAAYLFSRHIQAQQSRAAPRLPRAAVLASPPSLASGRGRPC